MERKNLKTLTTLLSKTAGLVFFSFLAISLGVVFGLLFDGWVKDQPGSPVDSRSSSLDTVELPITSDSNESQPMDSVKESSLSQTPLEQEKVAEVQFKVRVGPYNNHDLAVTISKKLQQLGYPIFVGKNPPFAIQVGAFSTRNNAEKLKTELNGKGYKSFIDQ